MKEIKVSMVVGVGKVLNYVKAHPNADTEEVMRHIMKSVDSKRDEKLAAIAAASRALKFKEKNPKANDKQIMQAVMNQTNEILTSLMTNEEISL